MQFEPIGTIRTPFDDRYDAPSQPGLSDTPAEGLIVLEPGHNFEQALDGLDGFDRVWVISVFNRNRGWRPKVLPPRGERRRRGVFATRSPHRPNPIGLSLFRILEISGRTIRVADVDLLDGTPILDLKPYIPYAEAFPQSRAGWLDDAAAHERATQARRVVWTPGASEQSDWLIARGIDLRSHVDRVLRRDPSPHPYRRIRTLDDGTLELAVRSWRARFVVDGDVVTVIALGSGYDVETAALAPIGSLHDDLAQREWLDRERRKAGG